MLSIVKRDLLILFRDKGSLFMIVLFPCLLVFILGNLLSNLDNADEAIDPMTIQVVTQTTNPSQMSAIDSFIDSLKDNDEVHMVRCESIDEARELVVGKQASTAVLFTDSGSVEVFQGYDAIQNRAITSIITGFVRQSASMATLSQYASEQLPNVEEAVDSSLINQTLSPYNRSMLDYYAVVCAVMILFMGGAIGGASNLYDARRNGTLARTLVSPKKLSSLYVQSVLSSLPQSVIQVVCVMVPSVYIFGAHYAKTFLDNALLFVTLVAVGIAVSAVTMIIGIFLRVNPVLAIMPVLWVAMFLSGTFSADIYIDSVTPYSPIWMVQNAAFDLTVFGRPERCLHVLAVSFVVFGVATLVGAALFRRKSVVMK